MLYKNYAMPDIPSQRARREEMLAHETTSPGRLHAQLATKDPAEAHKHHPHSLRYILRALEIITFTGKTKTELTYEQPVDYPLCMIGLWREKEDTNHRINMRIKQMVEQRLIEEVQGLLDAGYTLDHQSMQGIGYKEIVLHLQGVYSLEKAIEFLKRNSHRYAKRQRSRWRRYIIDSKTTPKDNVSYHVCTLV